MKDNRVLRWAVIVLAVLVLVVVGLIFYFRPTTVPDVLEKTPEEASTLLEAASLTLGEQGELATSTIGAGLIVEQWPAHPKKVARHSAVDVTVTVAPVPANVPDVVGRDVEVATKTLSGALYQVLTVGVFSQSDAEGLVLSQLPEAGAEWLTGRPVALAVSLGADDGTGVTVPDLAGKPVSVAMSECEAAGLVPAGFVADPTAVTASVVSKQVPKGGVAVARGTTVLMLFDTD